MPNRFEAIKAALERDLRAEEKLVLIAYIMHSDVAFTNAFPGNSTLARYAGVNPRRIKAYRDALVAAKLLKVKQRNGDTWLVEVVVAELCGVDTPAAEQHCLENAPLPESSSASNRQGGAADKEQGTPATKRHTKTPSKTPSKSPSKREESALSELFSLDEQGAGVVRNGSAFKWLDPKNAEPRKLTFQFIERQAPGEPREILLDFAESELIAAVDSGLGGGLHGIIRTAIDKGRLAAFKRRRLTPARAPAYADDDREPPAPPPISEGSWD
ncbi:helix-turn-helix domain-containing protein [Hyphomicrobium sp. CS1GBMeth3]|uniref:helix-turn-helix domain-containing protein n=1 Tax=Hyphomicrobium sp. CS1GBMeth3 TaxID=1892845 RepID=UPI000930612A|nr:helix-turn-helix domain-containing protein [Hyphomicrobium sp. CS1GBMeth3]